MGLPIPPIGLLLSLLLTMSLRLIDTMYLTLLESLPVVIRVIALILVALFAYSILRRLGGPYGFDERVYRHIETNVIYEVELPTRRIYDIKKLSKRDIIELLAGLYTILCRIGLREFNIDFSKIEEKEIQERVNRVFKGKSDRVFETIRKLKKIYEYHSGKRRFLWPPIIFWRRTLSKLILDSEMILETMGATIIGKPGVKGVEYRLRKI